LLVAGCWYESKVELRAGSGITNAAQQKCRSAEMPLDNFSTNFVTFEKIYLMRKLFLIIPALMILQITSYSQESISTIDRYFERMNRDKEFFGKPEMKYKDIEGTPYLFDGFEKGFIQMKSGVKISGEYRYDLYAGLIEFKRNENVFAIAIPDSIVRLQTELFTLGHFEFIDKKTVNKSFLLIVEEGHYTLCLQKKKIFRKAEPVKPYHNASPARFDDSGDDYYLKVGDSPAEKIGSEKDIIRVCGTDGEKAKAFIATGKLNVKKEEDLVKLVKYLNEGAKATRH
jgi:hypothetical protein